MDKFNINEKNMCIQILKLLVISTHVMDIFDKPQEFVYKDFASAIIRERMAVLMIHTIQYILNI